MSTKLFVGSLAYTANDADLNQLFGKAGSVVSAKVIMNRDTDQSKGFGFVEMSTAEEAQTAIKMFNGFEVSGRPLTVTPAKPMTDRPNRPSYGTRSRY